MTNKTMELVDNWQEKKLTCSKCGETRSVKYEVDGKYLCNKCTLSEQTMEQRFDERFDGIFSILYRLLREVTPAGGDTINNTKKEIKAFINSELENKDKQLSHNIGQLRQYLNERTSKELITSKELETFLKL